MAFEQQNQFCSVKQWKKGMGVAHYFNPNGIEQNINFVQLRGGEMQKFKNNEDITSVSWIYTVFAVGSLLGLEI